MYSLKEFKEKFDPLLQNYLSFKVDQFTRNTKNPFVSEIASYCKDLVSHGGKRIRPYLAYVMYVAQGGKDTENILKALLSLEIFHIFALVHDDIMDQGEIRHGIKTLHKLTEEKLKDLKREGDIKRMGESQAILVGDFLFSWSTEIFSTNKDFPIKNLEKAKEYFYKMIDEVILGQMLDVDITSRENPSKELIDEKTRLKTSRYSFVRPMEIGAALATSDDLENFCEEFGTNLGITFQLQDDMLDIIGDPELLNKNILSDVSEGQHTFFTNYILENSSMEQKEKLKEFLGGYINQDNYKSVQELFYLSGAIDAGKKIIAEDLKKSENLINKSTLNFESKKAFLEIIELIRKRSVT